MTTAVEIRRWTRSITAERADVVLRGRTLFLLPIRHVIRGIAFPGSWDKTLPRPHWFVTIPFVPPAGMFGGRWRGRLPIGRSTEEGFGETLNTLLRQVVDESLTPLVSLEAFHEATRGERKISSYFRWECLADHADYHSLVLAGRGQLDQAASVASGFADRWEPHWIKSRLEGERLMTTYRYRVMGREDVESADWHLALLSQLKTLATLASTGNRAGLATLLQDWERQGIQGWGLEDLWEPTPFPLERDQDMGRP
jgi:hypothetical protein